MESKNQGCCWLEGSNSIGSLLVFYVTIILFLRAKMSNKEMEETDVEQTDSGAAKTYPMQCSALRKNGYVMIKGNKLHWQEASLYFINIFRSLLYALGGHVVINLDS